MIKKVLSIILSVLMLLTSIPNIITAKEINKDTQYDPIDSSFFINNEKNLKDLQKYLGKVTAIGQVCSKLDNKIIVLEDVIDGEVFSVVVQDEKSFNLYNYGDIIRISGTIKEKNDCKFISEVDSHKLLENKKSIQALEGTISDLKNSSFKNLLLKSIKISNLLLTSDEFGRYLYDGKDKIKFKSNILPNENQYFDAYGILSYENNEAVFKVDYFDYSVYNSIKTSEKEYVTADDVFTVAQWAGTGNYQDPVVYADSREPNDMLDKNSFLELSTGAIPLITTSGTSKNYYLGSKGLSEGQYYQITTSTEYYSDINLSFRMRGSATSAKNWLILYSKDGINFTELSSFSISVDSVYEEFSFNFPKIIGDNEKFYIRIQVDKGGNIKDGSAVAKTANNRIDSISLKASPILDGEITAIPTVSPKSGAVKIGEEVTLSCDTSNSEIFYAFNNSAYKKYDKSNKPVFTDLPCSLTVYAKKSGLKDSLKITYYYTQEQVNTIRISPNGGPVSKTKNIKLITTTEDALIKYMLIDTPKQEISDINSFVEELLDSGKVFKTYTNELNITSFPKTIICYGEKEGCINSFYSYANFTESSGVYTPYFGQLHSHTSYSDGAGTCRDAFVHGSTEVKNLDFLAVTDHSNSFDNADSANINDGSMSEEWKEGHDLADEFTTDKFVGIMGYEMTWSNGLGHMNTFNSSGFQSRNQANFTNYTTALKNYYDALKTSPNSISQFNHPGTAFGDFSDFAHYDKEIDNLITLVEVGNGEGSIGSSGYFPSYEYYTRALDKGWHIAPTNNQDNHKGMWGDANTARSVAVIDGKMTRQNIYDSMKNMRLYATEDNDLSILYTLDDNIMGTQLEKIDVGEKINIHVTLNDPTDKSLGKVEVIVNGGLSIYSESVPSNKAEIDVSLPSAYSYYYIKVTEADGDIAVTAPVWIGEVESIGITNYLCDSDITVINEENNISLDIFNNENEDLYLNSIEFSVDDEIVHTVDLKANKLNTVESFTTKNYSFKYIAEKAGETQIKATVSAVFKGNEKIYSSVLKLSFIDPRMVTNIIIDGTHYNDYVTGNYGGQVNNITKIASSLNAKIRIITDKITSSDLSDCSLLIISAPAKKSGTNDSHISYSPVRFEEEFIKTVAEYVKNGGNLVICGTSDYQDREGYSTSRELNKILSAVGSDIRVNSDQAYDKVNNGGSSYRLYFDDFNYDTEYTKDLVKPLYNMSGDVIEKGQVFSAYSGCSISVGENGVPLVYGHETTYSLDSKDENGEALSNVINVEQGDVVAMASEKINNSNIIVAGSVFISDYEVSAEIDNSGSLEYANRTIIQNIIKESKSKLEISDIKTARNGDYGEIFRVVGTVTAGTSNPNNTFFDTIYVEDETAGITVFPYSEQGLYVGATIDITGYIDQYQGDKELMILEYEIIDNKNLKDVKPTKFSTKDSMDYEENGGRYIVTEGVVSDVIIENGIVSQFKLNDGSGKATIFIDGYISSGTDGTGGKYLDLTNIIREGNVVSAAGMLYLHPEGDSEESVACLRVKNTDDIVLVKEGDHKIILGDVNCDSKVTMLDVTTLQRIIAEIESFSNYPSYSFVHADVNKDGQISMIDVTEIQRFIAKLITEF